MGKVRVWILLTMTAVIPTLSACSVGDGDPVLNGQGSVFHRSSLCQRTYSTIQD
jgi:hypothetical protein